MYGYFGKILSVDLTDRTISVDEFDEEFAARYIGGNGFAARIIYDRVPPDTGPLSGKNSVVFATGPFTDTPIPGSGRGHLASISPVTGMFFDSNFGGDFAVTFKRSGYDALIITGKSTSPVYIAIDNGAVTIKDARSLTGKRTGEAHRLLREIEGPEIESALIGPAGENGVVYANIICSGKRVSAAGRGGIGAVLGSKNCKGVTVRGDHHAPIYDRKGLIEHIQGIFPDLKERARPLTEFGTPVLVKIINDRGKLATRNNQFETFKDADMISGELIKKKYTEKNLACHGCPIACGKKVRVTGGRYAGESVKMPEYETLYSLGAMLFNNDITSIFNGNTECDELGMDTISFGVTLAFLTEAFEKGLITKNRLGRELTFGEFTDLPLLVEAASEKQGEIGRLLAAGSEGIARELGPESEKMLYTVKGLEIPGHSARGLRNMGLGYATGTRGGSHHDARPLYYPNDPETDPGFQHQPEICLNQQNATALGDSLVLCRFVTERIIGTEINEAYIPLFKYVTGREMELSELKEPGERTYTLERLINCARGGDTRRDTLPYRVTHEPIPEGPSAGWFCPEDELAQMLKKYYTLRGWDENGIPTKETLKRLNITTQLSKKLLTLRQSSL